MHYMLEVFMDLILVDPHPNFWALEKRKEFLQAYASIPTGCQRFFDDFLESSRLKWQEKNYDEAVNAKGQKSQKDLHIEEFLPSSAEEITSKG